MHLTLCIYEGKLLTVVRFSIITMFMFLHYISDLSILTLFNNHRNNCPHNKLSNNVSLHHHISPMHVEKCSFMTLILHNKMLTLLHVLRMSQDSSFFSITPADIT